MTGSTLTPEPSGARATHRRYPVNVERRLTTRDGQPLLVRSIQPHDVPLLARFHATLSEETVRSRYFHHVGLHARIAVARLARICRPDPEVEAVLVAILDPDDEAKQRLIGVGRLEEMNGRIGELAVLVGDPWQHQGVGRVLAEHIVELARQKGLAELHAYILPDNLAMQKLCQRLGFHVTYSMSAGTMKAHLPLNPAA